MQRTCKIAIVICATFAHLQSQEFYPDNRSYYNQLESRRQVVLSALAGQTWMAGQDPRKRIYLGIVKMYANVDRQTGFKYLQNAVDDSLNWGCFNVYALMDAALLFKDQVPAEFVEKLKIRLAENFNKDLGFTENHKLQYRTARYLFGQTWPNGPNFADGMTPLEAKAEAASWIEDWIDRTVTSGMYEFDSVNYHSLYLLCFSSLYDFALDPLMKRKAWMVMHLLLADWAPEYLNGNWIGAHSREKYNQVTHTILNCGTAIPFGYLFFGNSTFHPELEETYYVGLAAVHGFRPMAMIGNIATDRTTPYTHRETKSPRKGLGICTGEIPVWKYDYVTANYALGSSYGDISAVENHRWDLTWISKHDGSTMFFINPSNSAKRLLKYFDAGQNDIIAEIVRQRPYYDNPNKWIEGSPFEEVFQHQNTLIALYNIPSNERNGHVNGFFSKIIDQRVLHPSGWIFCESDQIFFAVKPLTMGEWFEEADHFRLTLKKRQTGVIVEVAQKSEYADFKSFQKQILNNSVRVNWGKVRVNYTSSHGDRLDFQFGKHRLLNDKNLTFENWPLFDGPFVKSETGNKLIQIFYRGEKMVLDFNNFSVVIK